MSITPKFRTPKEVQKLWIDALRSGKYIQGKGYLKKENKFCCLGVLCDLAAKDGSQWQWSGVKFGKRSGIPPQEVVHYVNLSETEVTKLINMNDLSRKTFSDIADYLEKKFKV